MYQHGCRHFQTCEICRELTHEGAVISKPVRSVVNWHTKVPSFPNLWDLSWIDTRRCRHFQTCEICREMTHEGAVISKPVRSVVKWHTKVPSFPNLWDLSWNDARKTFFQRSRYVVKVVVLAFFVFNPTWGNDPIWRTYFFKLGWNHWGRQLLCKKLKLCDLYVKMFMAPTFKNHKTTQMSIFFWHVWITQKVGDVSKNSWPVKKNPKHTPYPKIQVSQLWL